MASAVILTLGVTGVFLDTMAVVVNSPRLSVMGEGLEKVIPANELVRSTLTPSSGLRSHLTLPEMEALQLIVPIDFNVMVGLVHLSLGNKPGQPGGKILVVFCFFNMYVSIPF